MFLSSAQVRRALSLHSGQPTWGRGPPSLLAMSLEVWLRMMDPFQCERSLMLRDCSETPDNLRNTESR